MAARVQKVRKRARPWRSIIAAVLASRARLPLRYWGVPDIVNYHGVPYTGVEAVRHASGTQQIITVAGAAAFLVFGLVAVLGLSC